MSSSARRPARHRASRHGRRPLRLLVAGAGALALAAGGILPAAADASAAEARARNLAAIRAVADEGDAAPPAPIDPQSWELPEWMGYDDYTPVPHVDWNEPSRQAAKPIRAALILGDFQDRDFIVTMEPGSDHFCLPVDPETNIFDPARGPVPEQDPTKYPLGCNPFLDEPIAREDVADFYADFYFNTPSDVNHFHTGNEFWLENSWGIIGVEAQGFGPYRVSKKEHEYGLDDVGGAEGQCPSGDNCSDSTGVPLFSGFDAELTQLSAADVTAAQATNGEDYDFRYLLHAAYDESGTWQQFGEILFEYPEDVTDTFGPPDAADRPDDENWANTRYIDWTSWAAAEGIWSHAVPGVLSVQGESDGGAVFAHELSHIFGVLDNYNNPFTPGRSYTGLWANLSRGSFGGPGGHHNRWQIPPTLGASMPSHHMLRNKIRLGFFANRPQELMVTDVASLQASGPAFGTIYPRAYPLFPTTDDTGLHGIQVFLGRDQEDCSRGSGENLQCSGGGYSDYSFEFVDRIGFDSYTPDHGILLAKNKQATDLAPFMWMIDSHPQDINEATPPPPNQDKVIADFYRPESGELVPIVEGDARQLADGLFHAGTGEGVVDEYVDEKNRLHFYVLDFERREDGVATYRVAVRHLDNGGPFPRGVEAAATGMHSAQPGRVGLTTFEVTGTGSGAADLVRVAVDAPEGWEVTFPYDVLEVAPGATVDVPVHWTVPAGTAAGAYALSLTATSETDASASSTAEGEAVVTAAGDEPVVTEPEPAPAPPPTPATGGGAVLLALVGIGAAVTMRRR